MNYKFNSYNCCVILGIISLILLLSLSGCISEGRTNLSINAPENVETLSGMAETLSIEIIPFEADAINVIINLSAPSGITLTDPHAYFQQYSKEFKKIPKGKREIILFNYSTIFLGEEYELILEAKADNVNTTRRIIKVISPIPAPKLEVGEYGVVNKTGDSYGTHVQLVLRKDSQNGTDVYVIKDILARETKGTYRLYYYTVENLAHIKTEYYEDDNIIGKMTEIIEPPSLIYGFPLIVGKKWNWNGTISGIGQTELNGEILGKEKLSIQGRNYDTFKIRLKYSLPLGTTSWEVWYSPDIKGVVREKGTLNMGGLIKEDNSELVQHGLPPNKSPDIQPVLQTTKGWKAYVDTDQRFSFNYPGDWKLDTSVKSSISVQDPKTGTTVGVTIEPIGKMSLEEYRKKVRNNLIRIDYENYTEVNGRKGYRFLAILPGPGVIVETEKLRDIETMIFVANENGYAIVTVTHPFFGAPRDVLEEITNSFIIKEPPVYTLLERK